MARRTVVYALAAGLVTFAVAGYWTYSGSDVAQTADQLEAQRAAARSEGVPLTYGELHPKPIPASENAAPDLLAALSAFHGAKTLVSGFLAHPPDILHGSMAEALKAKATLSTLGGPLASLRRTSGFSRLEIDRPFEQGPDLLQPEYHELEQLVTALTLRAQVAFRLSEMDECLADLRCAAHLSALLSDDPLLLAGLSRSRIEENLFGAIRGIADLRTPSETLKRSLEEIVSAVGPAPELNAWLRERTVVCINNSTWIPQHLSRVEAETPGVLGQGETRFLRFGVVQRANEANSIRYWRAVTAAVRETAGDYPSAMGKIEQVESDFAAPQGAGFALRVFTMPRISPLIRIAQAMVTHRQSSREYLRDLRPARTNASLPRLSSSNGT